MDGKGIGVDTTCHYIHINTDAVGYGVGAIYHIAVRRSPLLTKYTIPHLHVSCLGCLYVSGAIRTAVPIYLTKYTTPDLHMVYWAFLFVSRALTFPCLSKPP